MSFTMVATDFDDTLVPIGALLSERNRAALDRVRAKGITTVIASGRTSHGLFTQLDRNQVDTQGLYLIGYNGALACQAWDAKPLFSHQLDVELVRRAARALRMTVAAYTAQYGWARGNATSAIAGRIEDLTTREVSRG